MIDFTSVLPVLAIAATSMAFKETRWLGVVSIAALSYFYPVLFLVALVAGLGGGIYFFHQKGRRR